VVFELVLLCCTPGDERLESEGLPAAIVNQLEPRAREQSLALLVAHVGSARDKDKAASARGSHNDSTLT
jgi:hypothetical protein